MWGSEFTYTHITSLLTPPVLRLFVLPASTYQSALLSSPTVSDRFLHETRNMASMQRVTNAEHAI